MSRICCAVALHPEGVDRNTAEFMTHTVSQLSPSTRRAWIEIRVTFTRRTWRKTVALHPEGVDRNMCTSNRSAGKTTSPSTRRAWIEILKRDDYAQATYVALHPEGVDRNQKFYKTTTEEQDVALHPEGVDRNLLTLILYHCGSSRPPPGGRG